MIHAAVGLPIPVRLALGLVISALIGLVAHRRGSLSQSGVAGAIITGTLIFGFGGWAAGLTLIAFFVSSSLLSRFKENSAQKRAAAEKFDKGGQRDLWQALANGGAAAIFAVLGAAVLLIPDTVQTSELIGVLGMGCMAATVGALATANADTWATELGVLSQSRPRLLTNLTCQVAPGTSGGVTLIGLLAALAGAAFVSLVFAAVWRLEAGFAAWYVFIAATLGGFLGSLFDSVLGATVQAMYYCERRGKETEKQFENDGTPNRLVRGWRWLNNDWVNFIASLFGAGVTALITLILMR